MKLIKEFKKFAMRGNVIDLAVGVIIGGAFGKIVTSLVKDIIMPPIGFITGGIDFTTLAITLKEATTTAAGVEISAVTINYGNFINATVDFLIIAFSIFIAIKQLNRLQKKEEAKPKTTPKPTKDQDLLIEIRDLLKK